MSQRSSVESPQQSTANELKPAIQAVLGCLDVNLETELTQYRRQRKRSQHWVTPPSPLTGPPQPRTIELIPSEAASSQASPPALLAEKNLPEFAYTEILPPSLPVAIAPPSGSIEVRKTHKPLVLPDSSSAPDGYLESTEALLKSLDEEKPPAQTESNLTASLFTPLGLSSMLLFLLSCITLGFVAISPSGSKTLGLDRLFKQVAPATVRNPTNTATGSNIDSPPELPKVPNLTSKEFVELDLSTLSNIDRKPSPIPTPLVKTSMPPSPKPIPPENFSAPNLPNANQSAGSNQDLKNLSTALLPSPSPSPVKPGNSVSEIPSNPVKAEDGLYYVVMDLAGEQSLEQARKAVPEAYVRNFASGVKIQMGALGDPASAKRLMKELREKGIAAKYYQP